MAGSVGGTDELSALRRNIETFPGTVTLQLRAVAWRYSRTAMARAKQILTSKTHGHNVEGHQKTVDSIVVIEEPDKKQFLVTVDNPDNPNLGLWLERGTVHMTARPFMRPTSDEIEKPYQNEMLSTATQGAEKAFGS